MTAGCAASRRVLARTPVAPLPASSPTRPTGINGRTSAPPEMYLPEVCSFQLPKVCSFRLPLTPDTPPTRLVPRRSRNARISGTIPGNPASYRISTLLVDLSGERTASQRGASVGPGACMWGHVDPSRRRVCRDRGPLRTCGPVREPRRTGERCPATAAPPAACRCRGRRALTRWCVARGGGPALGAGRRCRSCGAADGLAPPAPAAPDRRRVGRRPRAVPARG